MRKPDVEILRLALDLAQTPMAQSVFIDDTSMFVETAARLGIRSVLHKDYKSTCSELAALGLQRDQSA